MRVNSRNVSSFLTSGRALFLPLQSCLWNLRRATKKEIASQGELLPYAVMKVVDFYPRMIDLMLSDEQDLLRELCEHETAMSNRKGGAFCCVAFWDARYEEGILFHKDGRKILSAYLPPLTMAEVIREQTILCCLEELSQGAKGIPIFLDHSISSGKHGLSELLEDIERCLE